MKNNNKKELRIVCKSGKYGFMWCLLDEEGEVESILREDVSLTFKSVDDLREMLGIMRDANTKPIIHSNSCNARMLGEG